MQIVYDFGNGMRMVDLSKLVDPETETINYDEVRRIALECKPRLLVAGASAYPRAIDFKLLAEIAHRHCARVFKQVGQTCMLLCGPSAGKFGMDTQGYGAMGRIFLRQCKAAVPFISLTSNFYEFTNARI